MGGSSERFGGNKDYVCFFQCSVEGSLIAFVILFLSGSGSEWNAGRQ